MIKSKIEITVSVAEKGYRWRFHVSAIPRIFENFLYNSRLYKVLDVTHSIDQDEIVVFVVEKNKQ